MEREIGGEMGEEDQGKRMKGEKLLGEQEEEGRIIGSRERGRPNGKEKERETKIAVRM